MSSVHLELVIGYSGVARLLGVTKPIVARWVSKAAHGEAPYARRSAKPIPLPELTAYRTSLWFAETIVNWAVREGLLEVYPQRVPQRRPVWTVEEVADYSNVRSAQARSWWRNTQRVAAGLPLDPLVSQVQLPTPDLIVEGVPLWYPEAIEAWWAGGRAVD